MKVKKKKHEKMTGASVTTVLEKLQAKYGEEAARIVDDPTITNVASISTGSILVDEALGIGGFPRGRICEIYGPEGSGKCLTADTYIATEYGLLTIAELFELKKVELKNEAQSTECAVKLLNRYFDYEKTIYFTSNGVQPVLLIKTESGFEVKCTPNHPLLVASKNGVLAWKKASDLEINDFVVSGCAKRHSAKYFDLSHAGYFADYESLRRMLTNIGLLGGSSTYNVQIETILSKKFRQFNAAGLKSIVSIIYDALCTVRCEDCCIEINRESKEFLFQLKLILKLYFDIDSVLKQNDSTAVKDSTAWTLNLNTTWKLSIHNENVKRYVKNIGTRSKERKAEFRKLLYTAYQKRFSNIFKPKNIWQSIKKIGDQKYAYDRIVAIEDLPDQPTFDFEMEKTHSFIANGLISHNTTVALHTIAEAQKQKKDSYAMFVDAEHALDLRLARKIGVDCKRLVVSQPDCGEQGLEIAEMAAESGKFDVIVVDSVAALVPRAELEGEMSDQQMGLQARMMGKGLRKIVAVNSKSQSVMIFVNQLRQKIGIMFGCFHADTPVLFADASWHAIKEIVENKLRGPVLTYNVQKKLFECKEILDWHSNGILEKGQEWKTIIVESVKGSESVSSFTCTENHMVFAKVEEEIVEVPAKKIKVGDMLVSCYGKNMQRDDCCTLEFGTGKSSNAGRTPCFVRVVEVKQGSSSLDAQKYDLTIAENGNYFVGGAHTGVLVHNSNETTTGGNALKFYASVRIDIRRISSLKVKRGDEEKVIGNVVKVKIAKNKLAVPYREIETELIFGKGFNKENELLVLGVNQSIIAREGASYVYNGKKLGHNKNAAQEALTTNPELFDKIYKDIQEARGIKHVKNRKKV